MNAVDLLASRSDELRRIVQESFRDANEQSQGFALRLLGEDQVTGGLVSLGTFDLSSATESAPYGGVPTVAYLGYGVGARNAGGLDDEVADAFERAVERLRARSGERLAEFVTDEVAVLGVADGLAVLHGAGRPVDDHRRWLVTVIERQGADGPWSDRLRELSAELLEQRGRLQTRVQEDDLYSVALELCLRHRWPQAFREAPVPDRSIQQMLMKRLLVGSPPDVGDLERAAVWLKALDVLAEHAAIALVPSVSETGRILRRTQAALKRWVWEEKSRRKDADPARWLVDNEYHVQSFLRATLYPIFGEQLQDETYLAGYGLVQPRADLVIINIKLIIEVKILRHPSDFRALEEQIAGDLGLYFSQLHRFDRLIAYIYDDCDEQHPELYDVLRHALMQRDRRVEDVVIVQRPSMIPDRSDRKSIVAISSDQS